MMMLYENHQHQNQCATLPLEFFCKSARSNLSETYVKEIGFCERETPADDAVDTLNFFCLIPNFSFQASLMFLFFYTVK